MHDSKFTFCSEIIASAVEGQAGRTSILPITVAHSCRVTSRFIEVRPETGGERGLPYRYHYPLITKLASV